VGVGEQRRGKNALRGAQVRVSRGTHLVRHGPQHARLSHTVPLVSLRADSGADVPFNAAADGRFRSGADTGTDVRSDAAAYVRADAVVHACSGADSPDPGAADPGAADPGADPGAASGCATGELVERTSAVHDRFERSELYRSVRYDGLGMLEQYTRACYVRNGHRARGGSANRHPSE
jgi:hypothetical protein